MWDVSIIQAEDFAARYNRLQREIFMHKKYRLGGMSTGKFYKVKKVFAYSAYI